MDLSNNPSETGMAQSSPTSPMNESPLEAQSPGKKRPHSSHSQGLDASSDEENTHEEGAQKKPRRTTRKACNECRQQKLKCDVQADPFKECSRCSRLKLDCRIDPNFKRVGKRSRNAEMEREIHELRRQLAERDSQSNGTPSSPGRLNGGTAMLLAHADAAAAALHEGVAGSLLDLRRAGGDANREGRESRKRRVLGDIAVGPDMIEELFKIYFEFYHPFLPILEPEKSPDQYFDLCPLTFWAVICVASRRFETDSTLLTGISTPLSQLTWATIASVPQNYHVVKALAILCTWPLPTKSTSTDPTFILAGAMMQIALQTGLHRPAHMQEFSRQRIEQREEDVRDRLRTWAVCNIVTQASSTCYGQPPKTVYDWTLTSVADPEVGQEGTWGLPVDLHWRLQIEMFCNKVSQKLYNNRSSPIGITGAQERAAWISLLVENYRDLERRIPSHLPIDILFLHAAGMHLRLSAFFDDTAAPNYANDLMELYLAATQFLKSALELRFHTGRALKYAPNYIVLMMLAGGFTLMKLLNSFFVRYIDADGSRKLFNETIWAIRSASVSNNDLPSRLAEVLAQLWRAFGAGMRGSALGPAVDGSLQLQVRCRMSMSLMYDSIWRWREEFQFKRGDGTTAMLDSAVNNPTNPDDPPSRDPQLQHAQTSDPLQQQQQQQQPNSTSQPLHHAQQPLVQSAPSSTLASSTPYPDQNLTPAPSMAMAAASNGVTMGGVSAVPAPGLDPPLYDLNYEFFDPLAWMLDGSESLYGGHSMFPPADGGGFQ